MKKTVAYYQRCCLQVATCHCVIVGFQIFTVRPVRPDIFVGMHMELLAESSRHRRLLIVES